MSKSIRISDKVHDKLKVHVAKAKKDGRKVSRIAEEVIMAYADGAWTITFEVTPTELKLKSSNKK